MQPVDFEGSNIIMNKPDSMTDDECVSGVPALVSIDNAGHKFTLYYFMPSYEDIQAINAGRGICLKILQSPPPPIAMYTLDENGEVN